MAVIQAINKLPGNIPFDHSDEEALLTFSEEVAMALKRRSVEATLIKVRP